jgi:hypothetical protein
MAVPNPPNTEKEVSHTHATKQLHIVHSTHDVGVSEIELKQAGIKHAKGWR